MRRRRCSRRTNRRPWMPAITCVLLGGTAATPCVYPLHVQFPPAFFQLTVALAQLCTLLVNLDQALGPARVPRDRRSTAKFRGSPRILRQ